MCLSKANHHRHKGFAPAFKAAEICFPQMQPDDLVPGAVLLVFALVKFVGSKKSCHQDNASGLGSSCRWFFVPEDHVGSQVLQGTSQAIPLPARIERWGSGGEPEQPSCYRPLSITRRLRAKEPSLSSNPEGRAATTYDIWKSFTDHLSLAKSNFIPGAFHGTRTQPPYLFVIIHPL